MGLVWAPNGRPIMGCQYGPHLGSPDGLDVHLAAGSMSAPNGWPMNEPTWAWCGPQMGGPLWVANMGPIWAAQMGSMSIWPRAPCPPQIHRQGHDLGLI